MKRHDLVTFNTILKKCVKNHHNVANLWATDRVSAAGYLNLMAGKLEALTAMVEALLIDSEPEVKELSEGKVDPAVMAEKSVALGRDNFDKKLIFSHDDEYCELSHLEQMVDKIKVMNCPDKANRWVGYIQGVLVARGLATVDDFKKINKGEA